LFFSVIASSGYCTIGVAGIVRIILGHHHHHLRLADDETLYCCALMGSD
jgi:hypothetical protein